MVMFPEIKYSIDLPDKVTASYTDSILSIKGPKGSIAREFKDNDIKLSMAGKKIELYVKLPKRKQYSLIGTWRAHINNMIKGVTEGFEYSLKVLYAHFPIKVTVKENHVLIENFLGEKTARSAEILEGVKVTLKGDILTVSGIDIEKVGQTAANIEIATKIRRFDPRVFQDGIYITNKGEVQ
ncbi:MAG: 50S ribosomal protein L6 [Thermoplasmata archaeon]